MRDLNWGTSPSNHIILGDENRDLFYIASRREVIYCGGAKRGRRSETGTRLVPRLGWPALRTNGVLQPQLARRPLNPLVFAERSALSMLTRTRPNSFALSGAFTRSVQSTGRATGQGDTMALIASSPCILAHRPLQRQCSARATNPAPTAFCSMYRKTVNPLLDEAPGT